MSFIVHLIKSSAVSSGCSYVITNNPIIVEIKSSTRKGSGTAFGSGHYQFKMKIAKEIFSDYDEPFFLKIRASEDSHGVGLTSRFWDHRKIAMTHSPMLTDLKHRLLRARFK